MAAEAAIYVRIPRKILVNNTVEKYCCIFSFALDDSLIRTLFKPRSMNTTKTVVKDKAKKYFPVPSAPICLAIKVKYPKEMIFCPIEATVMKTVFLAIEAI